MWAAQGSAMQGVFPKRGAHFNGTVHNPSHYSWIRSSFPMTDFHEQPQWLPLFLTWEIGNIFSLRRKRKNSARFRWFSDFSIGEISCFQVSRRRWKSWFCSSKAKSQPPAAMQLWVMWLQLTGTARAVWSPGLWSQAWYCNEKVTGCRVEMICSSFHWAFLKVVHWIKATKNNVKDCKRS